MHCWSHGACDVWWKHAPLPHDVVQLDVCGHPLRQRCIFGKDEKMSLPEGYCVGLDAIRNQGLTVTPFSAHPSYDRNPFGHAGPDN